MFRRSEPVLRILCLGLAALALLQLASMAARRDPLAGVHMPRMLPSAALATAPTSTNDPAKSATIQVQANLPPVVQTRVTRITESEILGPVPKPMLMPLTLLGIAGKDAFVRTTSGQTGLLRLGEEFEGIKLLQIGTNRVLVEQDGQNKELTMFSGFGSETLLPKGKEHPQ